MVTALGGPAAGQSGDPLLGNVDYGRCMRLVSVDGDQAFEFALAWIDRGGGFPARHCAASALFALDQFPQAAERLEALAGDMEGRAPPDALADLLGHAGIAWQSAGDLARAHAVQSAALALDPDNLDVRIDRAITEAQVGHWWEAIDDLNLVIGAEPDHARARVLRGAAYRQVEVYDLALDDLNLALAVAPDDPEGLLERGIVKRLTGDAAGARADWLTVLRLHDGRPAADMARRNLELLDVTPD